MNDVAATTAATAATTIAAAPTATASATTANTFENTVLFPVVHGHLAAKFLFGKLVFEQLLGGSCFAAVVLVAYVVADANATCIINCCFAWQAQTINSWSMLRGWLAGLVGFVCLCKGC